jgi:hypothetical protein
MFKNVLLITIILSVSMFAQVPTEGLIAHYPFNGNAEDHSGNGFNGVVAGAAITTDRRGEINSAYSFDGVNDGISIAGFNNNPQTFTISLWFFARTDGDAASKELIQRSNPSNKSDWSWNISWYKKNGPSKVYSGVKSLNKSVTDSADSAPKNNWNHVIMTWDGSTKKVYVNGMLKRTKYLGETTLDYSSQTGLYIGFDSEAGYFNGKIDDIRIYNRVLSLNEMAQLSTEGETYTLKLLSPAGGEDFVAGANHEIKWTGIGLSSVKIDYSLDSGLTWTNLVNNFNNTGTYIWTTPNTTSQNCLMKISNTANSAMTDISSSVFSIEQYKVKILSPDGDEICGIGKIFPITWNSNNIQQVNLDYSTDNGASWISITESYPSTGVYEWLVPATPSSQALVKITNTDTLTVYDISTNNFVITTITGIDEVTDLPESFSLLQNYPNPFNPSTVINYRLAAPAYVQIRIFDALGKEVAALVNQEKPAGTHSVNFNANNLSSGTYFYRIEAGNFTANRKMLLLK